MGSHLASKALWLFGCGRIQPIWGAKKTMKKLRISHVIAALTVLAPTLCGSTVAIAFDEVSLKKLQALNSCERCDLSGADLRGADLRGARLSDADLSDANLRGARLGGADLSGAYSQNADLQTADLRDARLSGDLSGANLSDANLHNADLSSANIKKADLRQAILCKTKVPWGEENSGCR